MKSKRSTAPPINTPSEMTNIHRLLQVHRGRCPQCGSPDHVMDRDRGEVVCGACGLVLNDTMLTRTPEWRAFTPEETKARVRAGAPTAFSRYDKGLSTTFHPSEGRLPFKTRLKMRRLKRWHIRSTLHSSAQRNLSQAMNVLDLLSDKLKLPRTVKEAGARIYRKALSLGLVRGRSIAAVAAASLYVACRASNTPRPLTEVVTASPRSRKEITRCYRLILREIDPQLPIDQPMKYVPKIASTLDLDQTIQNEAIQLLRSARKKRLTVGKMPVGMAAAALYLAALLNGDEVTQRALADASGVTEVTIRNRYQGLRRGLHVDLGMNSTNGG